MYSRRLHDVPSQRGIHENLPFAVWSRYGVVDHGGYEDWEVGGLFHGEMAQGQGAEELATPRRTGRQEWQVTRETWGRGYLIGDMYSISCMVAVVYP